nr:PREDICTED: single-pass membrane and coiled-coil domain-containing protein 1 [Struthio camelus australis]
MTKDGVSLRSLNKTLNRVENKLQTLETQFKDLKSSLDKLAWKFERHSEMLDNQMSQDAMWISMSEDRQTSAEINLLLSRTCETLASLCSLVTAQVPDLAAGLPSTAAVLRRKARHPRIQRDNAVFRLQKTMELSLYQKRLLKDMQILNN